MARGVSGSWGRRAIPAGARRARHADPAGVAGTGAPAGAAEIAWSSQPGARANQRAPVKPKLKPLAEPCLICGKWIADPKAAHYVEVDTFARAIVGEESAPDSQGAFPVGADCWRRLPAEGKASHRAQK
jgi:hypothetical protein